VRYEFSNITSQSAYGVDPPDGGTAGHGRQVPWGSRRSILGGLNASSASLRFSWVVLEAYGKQQATVALLPGKRKLSRAWTCPGDPGDGLFHDQLAHDKRLGPPDLVGHLVDVAVVAGQVAAVMDAVLRCGRPSGRRSGSRMCDRPDCGRVADSMGERAA
jgi:hypothetical protein